MNLPISKSPSLFNLLDIKICYRLPTQISLFEIAHLPNKVNKKHF